jgi:hypothetical protein
MAGLDHLASSLKSEEERHRVGEAPTALKKQLDCTEPPTMIEVKKYQWFIALFFLNQWLARYAASWHGSCSIPSERNEMLTNPN